jgi:hypothetical protein
MSEPCLVCHGEHHTTDCPRVETFDYVEGVLHVRLKPDAQHITIDLVKRPIGDQTP